MIRQKCDDLIISMISGNSKDDSFNIFRNWIKKLDVASLTVVQIFLSEHIYELDRKMIFGEDLSKEMSILVMCQKYVNSIKSAYDYSR